MKRFIIVSTGALYAVHYLMKEFLASWYPNNIRNYLGDILCLPIVLIITSYVLRKIPHFKTHVLTGKQIIAIWLYITLSFEVILPLWTTCVADPIDVLCYGLGAGLYCFYNNRMKKAGVP